MSSLTEEQQKKLRRLENNIAQIREKYEEEKKSAAPLALRRELEKEEKEKKNLEKELKEAEKINQEIEDKQLGWINAPISDPNDYGDKYLYEVQVSSGNTKRISICATQSLLLQLQGYFSYLDCPFPDDNSSNKFTDAQKQELLESIIPSGTALPKKNGAYVAGLNGSDRVPIDANNSTIANAGKGD